MNLHGKNAVITGAAAGIGRATALELAGEGTRLLIADIDEDGLGETRTVIEAAGGRCLAMKVDVSDERQVREMAEAAIDELGCIDILVNVAGVTLLGEISDHSLEDWQWIAGINFWGPIYGVHHVLGHMIERRSGHIVNVASAAGLVAMPGNGSYCSTKFGVVGFSEVLSSELYRHGIKVSLVCPAGVATDFEKNAVVRGLPQFVPGAYVKSHGRTPDYAARKIAGAIKKEKFLVIIGYEARLFYWLKRLSPFLYYRVGRGMAGRLDRWR